MFDDEEKDAPKDSSIPEWQRTADSSSDEAATTSPSDPEPTQDALDVARRFLSDEQVKSSSREKKVEFLKAKGIEDGDIQKLLEESGETAPSQVTQPATDPTTAETAAQPETEPAADRPPIITYPEFLARQTKSSKPPLVTATGVLAAVQTTAALSVLVAGASRYIFTPMFESLTEARSDLQATTSTNLATLITKLEDAVSEIPPVAGPRKKLHGYGSGEDSDSDSDDPTELFHRDIGTQTMTPRPSWDANTSPSEIDSNVSSIRKMYDHSNDAVHDIEKDRGLGDIIASIKAFRDDLDLLTYPSADDMMSYAKDYRINKNAAETQEVRQVKESIRRIKGTLLSTRNFPAPTG